MRNTLVSAAAFGATAAVAGFVWTALEFPFVILAPAAVGWFVATRWTFGRRLAWSAALGGGFSFTAAFLVAVFFALADGSPVSLAAWMSATLAATVAGAATGLLLGGRRRSLVMALWAGGGMFAATIVAGVLRWAAPPAVDVEGVTQYLYFALTIGVIGLIEGAAIGAGAARAASVVDERGPG